MFNSFDPKIVGNTVTMSTDFYDANGVKIVPDSVSVHYKNPNGIISDYVVIAVNGKYAHSVLLDVSGIWYFRWDCTGTYASAEEFQIAVRESNLS